MSRESFLEHYGRRENPQERVDFLQQRYGLESLTILARETRSLLGTTFMGRASRDEEGYKIVVDGDERMSGYLTLHEFLHVWLEETGKTFDISHENPVLAQFLFELRNLINDYLIETEVVHQCEDNYADEVSYTKNRQIIAQFIGQGVAPGFVVFVQGMLTLALAELYPEIKDQKAFALFSDGIEYPNKEAITACLSGYDARSITPEEYRALAAELCELLTGSKMSFEAGKPSFSDTEAIQNYIQDCDAAMDSFRSTLGSFLRRS